MSTEKPAFIVAAETFVSFTDDVKAKYSGAGGAGDSPFGYRRGVGADAVSFLFALNGAYGENAPLSRAAVAEGQCAMLEAGLWPGRTRAAVEQQLASLYGRGNVTQTAGAYALSERGLSAARLMFADMGLTWPGEGEQTPKARKPRRRKAAQSDESQTEVTTAEVATTDNASAGPTGEGIEYNLNDAQ